MWQIRECIDIAQPPETVFDYLSRFDSVREWDPGVRNARRRSPGPPRVGSRFGVTLGFGWRSVPMDYTIEAMDRPRELVLRGRGRSFSAVDRIVLEKTAGGTRLTYRVAVDFDTPPPRIVDPVLRWWFRRGARRAIRRLGIMLSGEPDPPRLTPLTLLADRSIVFGMLGFTRLGTHLARRRRLVASGLYAAKTMVLTGGTSGIGRAAARELYLRGAHLVVVGRDGQKLQQLRQELLALDGEGRIETEIADMGQMAEVRALAGRLLQRGGPIDVLIHNAGALFNAYRQTGEGIEETLATNLAGPYLLTRLLLPALRASGAARVILVASGGMYTQKIDVRDWPPTPEGYDGPTAYARAKRGLVILASVWGRQWAPLNIRVHAMHPGWVDTPGLKKSLPAFHRGLSRWLRTAAQGADTIVWLAAAPDAGRTSGGFWLDRKLRATHVFPGTRESGEDRRRLIEALDTLTGLTPSHENRGNGSDGGRPATEGPQRPGIGGNRQ